MNSQILCSNCKSIQQMYARATKTRRAKSKSKKKSCFEFIDEQSYLISTWIQNAMLNAKFGATPTETSMKKAT